MTLMHTADGSLRQFVW